MCTYYIIWPHFNIHSWWRKFVGVCFVKLRTNSRCSSSIILSNINGQHNYWFKHTLVKTLTNNMYMYINYATCAILESLSTPPSSCYPSYQDPKYTWLIMNPHTVDSACLPTVDTCIRSPLSHDWIPGKINMFYSGRYINVSLNYIMRPSRNRVWWTINESPAMSCPEDVSKN